MHECYLQEASSLMQKIKETVAVMRLMASPQVIAEIESYLGHADRQMDQIRRRVIFGEVIPHGEKVFSVLEPHTEWISQGKAGGLFARFEARPKSFRSRPLCAFDGCVHFANHMPCAESA